MSIAMRTRDITFEDFCFLVKDDQKADLIDGVIYMASPENTDANELLMWLIGLMGLFVQVNGLGKIYGSRVALRLDNRNGPEPDLAFVKKSRLRLVKRGHIAGAADLVIEIVSPDSIERDYVKKRRLYQRAGIPEYWIIDELKQQVICLRLDSSGKYRTVKPADGRLHSQVISGFWFRPEWLWQNPLPQMLDVFVEIRATRT
jgi:Uma2 family endonuclease